MKRVRTLGLAAVAALALTASFGAASASAAYLTASEYPAYATAEPTTSHTFAFSGGRMTSCDVHPFASELSGPAEALTPAAMYDAACTKVIAGKTIKSTLDMNGCKFIFHLGEEAESPGSFDIGPAGCGSITLTESGTNCIYSFAAQTGVGPVYYRNLATGLVEIEANQAGMQFTVEGPSAGCGVSGVATYTGTWELYAENEAGVPVDAEVVTDLPVGLYLTGAQSEEAANQPKIEAEQYPVDIVGEQDAAEKHAVTFAGGRKLACAEVDMTSEAAAATSSLALEADYRDCTVSIAGTPKPATVLMNSCGYDLDVLNSGPPYVGSLGVQCANGGDGIEVKVYNSAEKTEAELVCVYKIGAQQGLSGVGLENFGQGSARGIEMSLAVGGISYSRTKGSGTNCGVSASSATYGGASILQGAI